MSSDENLIETVFCEEFNKLKSQPLIKEEIQTLLSVMLNDEIDSKLEEDKKFNEFFQVRVVKKRIEVMYDFKLDNRIILFLLSKFESNLGKYIMTLTMFQYFVKKEKRL